MNLQSVVTNLYLSFLVLLAIANVGCTTSVHPILLKEDLSTDIDLSGEWTCQPAELPARDNKISRVILQRVGDSGVYDVTGDDGETAFDALRIGKIGHHRICELKGGPRDGFSPFKTGLPLYGLARFEIMNDELRVYHVNDSEIRRALTEQRVATLLHESGPGEEWLIITATTAELQSFIKSSADNIFAKTPICFKRTKKK